MVILDYLAWQRLNQMLNAPEQVSYAAEKVLQLLMAKLAGKKEGSEHGKHQVLRYDSG